MSHPFSILMLVDGDSESEAGGSAGVEEATLAEATDERDGEVANHQDWADDEQEHIAEQETDAEGFVTVKRDRRVR